MTSTLKPENADQRGFGELLEVYTQVAAPDGEALLFEIYQRQSSVEERGRSLLAALVPLVVVPLLVLLTAQSNNHQTGDAQGKGQFVMARKE